MMTYEEEVEALRVEINRLNQEIVERLAQRVRVATKIGEVKKRHGKPIVDRSQEAKVLEQAQRLASENRIDPEGVERVIKEIIRLCTEAELEEQP